MWTNQRITMAGYSNFIDNFQAKCNDANTRRKMREWYIDFMSEIFKTFMLIKGSNKKIYLTLSSIQHLNKNDYY